MRWASAVVLRVKPPPAVPSFHMGGVSAAPLLLQLATNVPGRAAETVPSARSCTPTWETQKKHLLTGF